MWKLPLIGMMLLSACVTTVGSADAICSIPTPTFTMSELEALSDQTLAGLDLFAERFRVACGN